MGTETINKDLNALDEKEDVWNAEWGKCRKRRDGVCRPRVIKEDTAPYEERWLLYQSKTDQLRICVDLKMLNRSVKREKEVLPTIDGILPKLTGFKVFFPFLCSLVSGYNSRLKVPNWQHWFGKCYYITDCPLGLQVQWKYFRVKWLSSWRILKAIYMNGILKHLDTPVEHVTITDKHDIRPDEAKVKAITDWTPQAMTLTWDRY